MGYGEHNVFLFTELEITLGLQYLSKYSFNHVAFHFCPQNKGASTKITGVEQERHPKADLCVSTETPGKLIVLFSAETWFQPTLTGMMTFCFP